MAGSCGGWVFHFLVTFLAFGMLCCGIAELTAVELAVAVPLAAAMATYHGE